MYVGDVIDALLTMPDQSVQMCVTSPPYWGLRDYGTGSWEGGDSECGHLQQVGGTKASTLGAASGGNDMSDEARERSTTRSFVPYRDVCGKCGATRVDRQLGLEATPEEYVARMVEVFREVRRVLRADGTCWLNIGDSYATSGTRGYNGGKDLAHMDKAQDTGYRGITQGLNEKDLVGIPWRLAFALQADGWYLRSDIVWSKPNPMPESVTDRPTKAHEYLFLLTKNSKYYYDKNAIAEPADWDRWGAQTTPKHFGTNNRAGWIPSLSKRQIMEKIGPRRVRPSDLDGASNFKGGGGNQIEGTIPFDGLTRNKRTVWNIATQPYRGSHYATFPEKLVEPCILAGSKIQDTVIDPFIGSGTTAQVARSLDRRCVGIDLDPKNVELVVERYRQPTKEEKRAKKVRKSKKPRVGQLSLDLEET